MNIIFLTRIFIHYIDTLLYQRKACTNDLVQAWAIILQP